MRAAALLVAALLAGAPAAAGEVSFCRVCSGARFVQTRSALLIYCPNAERPWLTYEGCPKAIVLRDGAGNYRIRCG